MLLMCTIMLAIDAGGIAWLSNADVEGKLIKESDSKYLVDFSQGVKEFKLAGKPSDYAKVLVDKDKCVKE